MCTLFDDNKNILQDSLVKKQTDKWIRDSIMQRPSVGSTTIMRSRGTTLQPIIKQLLLPTTTITGI